MYRSHPQRLKSKLVQKNVTYTRVNTVIFSALQFHFWPLGGQILFSCMCPTTLSFQPIISKFAPITHWTMLQTQVHFCHHLTTFVATKRPNAFFSCMCPTTCSFQPIFSKLTPDIHWTMLHTPVPFCHNLGTYVATRGTNALWPLGGHLCGT